MDEPGTSSKILVVTDLDGTLLDEYTYEFASAGEALDMLRTRAIPLVLATSKTRSEVALLAAAIGVPAAWIVENGGAVVIPEGFSGVSRIGTGLDAKPLVITLGVNRTTLVDCLSKIASGIGVKLQGFSGMSLDELVRMTGLSPAAAKLAADREYDEPFTVDDDAMIPAIVEAASSHGLTVTRGGRFWHISGPVDKGRALLILLDWLAERHIHPVTIGLGDSPNDLSFLKVVNHPILMPRPDGKIDGDLEKSFPEADRAPRAGPDGWKIAVIKAVASLSI